MTGAFVVFVKVVLGIVGVFQLGVGGGGVVWGLD